MAINLLQQKNVIQTHLQNRASRISIYNFNNLYSWHNAYEYDIRLIDGCMCVFMRNEIGCFLYLPPIGHIKSSVIKKCFMIMSEINGGSRVTRVENVGDSDLKYFPTDQYNIIPKTYEYIYLRSDIANYEGNAYKSKRNMYNYCSKNYECRFELYDVSMADDCMALYDVWAAERTARYEDTLFRSMMQESRSVNKLFLYDFNQLNMIGRVVYVDGKIQAYTFGYELRPDMFCVVIETANLNVKGLPAFIFREFCRDPETQKYQFVNVMDDYGAPNLTVTKMSFNPLVMLRLYTIEKKR
jgi:uncharacterized protein